MEPTPSVAPTRALFTQEDSSSDRCIMNALFVRWFPNLQLQSTRRGKNTWQDKNRYPRTTIPSPKLQKKLDIQGPPEKGTTKIHGYKSCGNIIAFFAQGELGRALRCGRVAWISPKRCDPYAVLLVAPWRTGPPLQPQPLVPVGFEPLTLWPLRLRCHRRASSSGGTLLQLDCTRSGGGGPWLQVTNVLAV